jgi:hypothetical protein
MLTNRVMTGLKQRHLRQADTIDVRFGFARSIGVFKGCQSITRGQFILFGPLAFAPPNLVFDRFSRHMRAILKSL